MLDSQTAAVSAKGGAIHSQGEITKALLQEAARQSLRRGYDYFQVLQANAGADTLVSMSPTTFINTGGGTYMAMPGVATTSSRPKGDLMVRFYRTRPDAPNVWEARAVLAEK
jgi:hypothetical protein